MWAYWVDVIFTVGPIWTRGGEGEDSDVDGGDGADDGDGADVDPEGCDGADDVDGGDGADDVDVDGGDVDRAGWIIWSVQTTTKNKFTIQGCIILLG